jgi:polar amino acid transport system ATP-binding protein
MIAVDRLTKRRDGRTVLRELSLCIPARQSLALIGPSGGGKSTLLRCILGLDTFDEGTIRVGDERLLAGAHAENRTALARIRRRTGMVFQQWHLFAHLTALQNVMEAPVHVAGLPRAQAEAEARALLERVGVAHRADALPRRLSGGEQQRVAIARALAMKPEVLLLDEPTSALDPERVTALAALLRELGRDGLTLVCVTHDMEFVTRVADRAVLLAGGEVVEEGTPVELLGSPRTHVTRAFLGLSRNGS